MSLFSGIDGFELGFPNSWKCIGFSEVNKHASQIYLKHFSRHKQYGDITRINTSELCDFELLCGGFPCQAFSIAGKRRGFDDTRGTLFFQICRLAKDKRPRLLLLENVRGLLSHDRGRTFHTIIGSLDDLGYDLQWQVLNSKDFGVPQNRERVYIVGHLRGTRRPEVFPLGERPAVCAPPLKGEEEETAPCLCASNGGSNINHVYVRVPEPAATAFAVAAFMGLRHGEIQGLLWESYRDGELYVSRSIWNGRVSEPKTRKGRAPVPVIRQLADRLEMHRLRSGNPLKGPIFANSLGNPLSLGSVVNRVILPALNRCEGCGKAESVHQKAGHPYRRDAFIPEWHGWHAARRGLGSNLYRLGVPDLVIQRILRHANVSTTATYYIKTATDDVRKAMTTLENHIAAAGQTKSKGDGAPRSTSHAARSMVQ